MFTADQARKNVKKYQEKESLQRTKNTKICVDETLNRIEALSNKGETSITITPSDSGLIDGEAFKSAMQELGFSVTLTRIGFRVHW